MTGKVSAFWVSHKSAKKESREPWIWVSGVRFSLKFYILFLKYNFFPSMGKPQLYPLCSGWDISLPSPDPLPNPEFPMKWKGQLLTLSLIDSWPLCYAYETQTTQSIVRVWPQVVTLLSVTAHTVISWATMLGFFRFQNYGGLQKHPKYYRSKVISQRKFMRE